MSKRKSTGPPAIELTVRHRPKMTDVAQLAGVSAATVSRALAGSPRVSAQTRARIAATVQATGYVVSHTAQRLRLRRAGQIFVVVPDIANPFFADILLSIQESADRAGLSVVIGNGGNDAAREDTYAEQLLSGAVDGMVYMTERLPAALLAPRLLARLVAVVERRRGTRIPIVQIDNTAAAGEVVRHLAALGHRRIVHLAGVRRSTITRQRARGFTEAMQALGLAQDVARVMYGAYTMESGAGMMQSLLRSADPPTAVVCSSDEMAIGAIRAIRRAGLRVPHDISVAGFDDIRIAAAYDPPLTTIRQPRARMGREAVAKLLQRLQGEAEGAMDLILPHELVVRESTGRAPGARPASAARFACASPGRR